MLEWIVFVTTMVGYVILTGWCVFTTCFVLTDAMGCWSARWMDDFLEQTHADAYVTVILIPTVINFGTTLAALGFAITLSRLGQPAEWPDYNGGPLTIGGLFLCVFVPMALYRAARRPEWMRLGAKIYHLRTSPSVSQDYAVVLNSLDDQMRSAKRKASATQVKRVLVQCVLALVMLSVSTAYGGLGWPHLAVLGLLVLAVVSRVLIRPRVWRRHLAYLENCEERVLALAPGRVTPQPTQTAAPADLRLWPLVGPARSRQAICSGQDRYFKSLLHPDSYQ